MGLFRNLFSGSGKEIAAAVSGTLESVGKVATDIRSAITGDLSPEGKAKLQEQATEAEKAVILAQAEINKIEAASSRLFVAGWRPAVGWICAISLAVYYWPRFLIGMTLWILEAIHTKTMPPAPDLGIMDIVGLLGGILGLGTLRTVEKAQGVQANH